MAEEQNNTPQPSSGAPDDKTLLVLTHLSGIILGFIVPLVMYLVKTDGSDSFKASVKEALNFQITIAIGFIIASVLSGILIGFLLIPLVGLTNVILCIMAAVAISNGKDYKYPFALRLIK